MCLINNFKKSSPLIRSWHEKIGKVLWRKADSKVTKRLSPMVVRVTFRLYITPKSVKMHIIFLHLDKILAKILPPPKLNTHCVKSVCIRSYFGPYFPAFGLNTNRYSLSLRIQSEWGKIRTWIHPNTNTFYAVTIGFHQTLNERTYSAAHTPWLLDLVNKSSQIASGKIIRTLKQFHKFESRHHNEHSSY